MSSGKTSHLLFLLGFWVYLFIFKKMKSHGKVPSSIAYELAWYKHIKVGESPFGPPSPVCLNLNTLTDWGSP